MNGQQLKQQVNYLLKTGKHGEIKALLLADKDTTEHDNDLAMVCYLCTIYEQEEAAGQTTIFAKIADMQELLERYTALKFYLRRIDFGVMDDMGLFYQFLMQNQVSSYELLRVIDFSVVHREMVLQTIGGGLTAEEAAVENASEDVVNGAAAENASTGAAYGMAEENGSTDATDGATVENAGADVVNETDRGSSAGDGRVKEFCFIICTNSPAYAAECIYYINHLIVPKGVAVDILTVEEAKSLASGYNEAMQCSRAKYKVYLHHDTFIINPDFIQDCLDIFAGNPRIGMIGNVGVIKMPDSGVMWDADRYGMLYEQHIYETKLLANAVSTESAYLEVEAIDGFLMVTQYDIPWRDDLFDKWDFYDCSQSMEFIRQGYQVVVPNMKQPWCVHDCGFINLKDYDIEKEKFIAEYLTDKKK